MKYNKMLKYLHQVTLYISEYKSENNESVKKIEVQKVICL